MQKKSNSNRIFLCSQCIDKQCGLVLLHSNKLQQPDHNMNIISSLNFVQLHRFIGFNEEEFAGDTETDITGTVGEESETESSSLQPRTTRKLDIIIITITIIIKSGPLTILN